MEEKTVRCTRCETEFTDEELEGVNCCPKCGTKGIPCSTKHDVTIKINWHELQILCNWATFWSNTKSFSEDSKQTLKTIVKRLERQNPEGLGPLTLEGEVRELQDEYPGAELICNGKVIVPPLDEGKA